MVFHRLFHESPDLIEHLDAKFRQLLAEKDPEILSAILCLHVDFVKADPNKYKDIIPTLITILEQVIDKWLPITYDYHGVPAPWIQIKIIEIMGLLAKDDEKYLPLSIFFFHFLSLLIPFQFQSLIPFFPYYRISMEVEPHIIHTLKKVENGVDSAYGDDFFFLSQIIILHAPKLNF